VHPGEEQHDVRAGDVLADGVLKPGSVGQRLHDPAQVVDASTNAGLLQRRASHHFAQHGRGARRGVVCPHDLSIVERDCTVIFVLDLT
jgi:hypothetical protein